MKETEEEESFFKVREREGWGKGEREVLREEERERKGERGGWREEGR